MRKTLEIPGRLRLELSLNSIRFGLKPEMLFGLAARKNEKRSFLFVSRVLGKHVASPPQKILAAAKLLALALTGQEESEPYIQALSQPDGGSFSALMQRLAASRFFIPPEQRTLFVGFAETATGLAQAVASCFSGEMAYVSTTRLPLAGQKSTDFLEEHSHARQHRLYLEPIAEFIHGCRRIALVDDELTTGNTIRNVIRQLYRLYGVRNYLVLTLLDWRDENPMNSLEEELGIHIEVVSLIRGSIEQVEAAQELSGKPWEDFRGQSKGEVSYCSCRRKERLSSRLPLSAQEMEAFPHWCEALAKELPVLPGRTLYLGTGEFIYAPLLLAGYLGAAAFQSTTQSPIFLQDGSEISSGACFDPLDSYSPVGYLYNIPKGEYQSAIIFAEGAAVREQGIQQLALYLSSCGINQVEVALL